MKHILTTIAAVVLVGCGESQQSSTTPETKLTKPVAEATKPEPPTAEAPDISIHKAAYNGNIEAVKKHLATGTEVDAKEDGWTPLFHATIGGHKEIVELLIAEGANVNYRFNFTPLHLGSDHKEISELLIAEGADLNAKDFEGDTPLDAVVDPEIAKLFRKHGGKTKKELEAKGK